MALRVISVMAPACCLLGGHWLVKVGLMIYSLVGAFKDVRAKTR
jgi:hypothetical protein